MARPENQQGRLAIDESLANAQSAVRTCVRVGSGVSQDASDAIAASIAASLTNKKACVSLRKPLIFLAPEVGLEPTTP